MKPRIPSALRPAVREAILEGEEARSFKCDLGHGRTLYAVVIDRDGVIRRVGERTVIARSDIGFSPSSVISVTPC